MSFLSCPVCGADVDTHSFIGGFQCSNTRCTYQSNGVIFTAGLPSGMFDLPFFESLIQPINEASSDPPDNGPVPNPKT